MKHNFWLKLKKPILALAPMAGVTDAAFRQLCRICGADVVYTEMISADGLFYNSKKTLEMLKFDKLEHPIVIQLFGKYPERFTKAAQIAEQFGFDGIDINFGCPAKKVVKHGGGVTLMRDLNKCRKIIEETIKGTNLPVSVKFRTSIKSNQGIITAIDFIKSVNDLPISTIMIHGRPYENPFNADIDYETMKLAGEEFLKQNNQRIFLGNGGINTPFEAKKMIDMTGCHGVGLARGLYGKPWLFKQCHNFFNKGKFKEFTHKDIKKIALLHAKLAKKNKNDYGIIELRKHLLWYVKGWPNAKELRSQLVTVKSVDELKKILKQI